MWWEHFFYFTLWWREKRAHPERPPGQKPCTQAAAGGQQTQIWWPCPEEAPAPGGRSAGSLDCPAGGHQIAWPWPLPWQWTFWTPAFRWERAEVFLVISSMKRSQNTLTVHLSLSVHVWECRIKAGILFVFNSYIWQEIKKKAKFGLPFVVAFFCGPTRDRTHLKAWTMLEHCFSHEGGPW